MRTDNPWKKHSSKVVYQNRWMRIVEDSVITPTGSEGIYAYLDSKDSVIVAVLNDNNELCVIHTFAYPDSSWNWEMPGGGSEGEDPETAAKRELLEETGITASSWHKLGCVRVCNGFMTEKNHVFLARGISFGHEKEDADEQIETIKFVSMDEIDAMIERGEINDSQTITAIHLLQKHVSKELS